MCYRFKLWLWLFAVAFTQGVFNTTLAGLWWVVTGKGEAPDPDEPLSSRIGRNAILGKKWALVLEWLVDRVLGQGHCRSSRP